jgi:hypothetical protein
VQRIGNKRPKFQTAAVLIIGRSVVATGNQGQPERDEDKKSGKGSFQPWDSHNIEG